MDILGNSCAPDCTIFKAPAMLRTWRAIASPRPTISIDPQCREKEGRKWCLSCPRLFPAFDRSCVIGYIQDS